MEATRSLEAELLAGTTALTLFCAESATGHLLRVLTAILPDEVTSNTKESMRVRSRTKAT